MKQFVACLLARDKADFEAGRQIYEDLLAEHPLDASLWMSYIDFTKEFDVSITKCHSVFKRGMNNFTTILRSHGGSKSDRHHGAAAAERLPVLAAKAKQLCVFYEEFCKKWGLELKYWIGHSAFPLEVPLKFLLSTVPLTSQAPAPSIEGASEKRKKPLTLFLSNIGFKVASEDVLALFQQVTWTLLVELKKFENLPPVVVVVVVRN